MLRLISWVQSYKCSARVRMRLAKSHGTMIKRCCNKSISPCNKQLLDKLSLTPLLSLQQARSENPHPLGSKHIVQLFKQYWLWLMVAAATLYVPLRINATRGHTDCLNNSQKIEGPLVFESVFQVLHLDEHASYHRTAPHLLTFGVPSLFPFFILYWISYIS